MAPELIEEKPYDHTADIWSLGCIIYELLVGVPPFSTTSLFQLIKKIRYESVQWPGHLTTMAKDWLQGTLEKDCRRRMTWPDLHNHPFVVDHVSIQGGVPGALNNLPPLTNTLTASQELAKEIQRQDKAKLLPGGSQTLIKVAQKHEIQKQQLAAAQKALLSRKPGLALDKRRFSDGSHLQGESPAGKGMLLGRHHASHMSRRMSEFGQQLSMLPHLAQAQYIAPVKPIQQNAHLQSPGTNIHSSGSRFTQHLLPHTQTGQSHFLSTQSNTHLPSSIQHSKMPLQHLPVPVTGHLVSHQQVQPPFVQSSALTQLQSPVQLSLNSNPPPVQFTQNVQKTGLAMPEPIRNTTITGQLELAAVAEKLSALKTEDQDEKNISLDSNETLKNDADVTLQSEKNLLVAEDTLLENDEWCEFLDGQLEEMIEEWEGDGHLDCVDNPNFLGMIIGPLRNKNTNPLVLQKITNILMLPLSAENQNNLSYQKLLKAYFEKNIVNLLLLALEISACKKDDSTDDDDLADLENSWIKIMSLLCHLVHCEEMFADQVATLDCDTFVVLLSSANSEIISDTLAFLSKVICQKENIEKHFMKSVVEEITEELLLDETSNSILIKIFYFLGLTARNYPNCVENMEKLSKDVSKFSINAEEKDLQRAISFALFFLK